MSVKVLCACMSAGGIADYYLGIVVGTLLLLVMTLSSHFISLYFIFVIVQSQNNRNDGDDGKSLWAMC